MKLTQVISIPEMDLIARPVAVMKKEYILSYGGIDKSNRFRLKERLRIANTISSLRLTT